MAYVIYRTDTTEIVAEKQYAFRDQVHKTLGHAKASLTRIRKKFAEGFAKRQPYSTFRFEGLGLHENGKSGRQAEGELTGKMVEMKIVDLETYRKSIEATEIVYSIHDTEKKHPIKQSVNTPHFLSPSSETYWSM